MMKGVVHPAVFIVVILVGLFALGSIGLLPGELIPASITDFDPTCVPGQVLKPTYITLRCEPSLNKLNGVSIPTQTAEGFWPVTSYRIKEFCPPAGNAVEEGCQFRILTSGRYVKLDANGNQIGNIVDGPAEISYSYGDVINIRLFNAGMSTELRYTTKVLNMYSESGIFGRQVCDTCDTSCMVGTELYNKLPRDQQRFMNVGDTALIVERWNAYPVAGNLETYNNQPVDCVFINPSSVVLYGLEKYDSIGGCYYFRGEKVATGECCPTDSVLGASCGADFKLEVDGPGGCCDGGLCSASNCPGQGWWDFDGWRPGSPLYSYKCNAVTGSCDIDDVKYGVQCDPMTGSGCPENQICDSRSWTCTSAPLTQMSCVEYGQECCVEGFTPPNVDLRTCVEAGYPANFKCVSGFCHDPLPVNQCNYDNVCDEQEVSECPDCGICDWLCMIQKFLVLWLVGSILAAILLTALAVLIPPIKLWVFPPTLFTFVLVIVTGLVLAIMFMGFVGGLAAVLL